MPRSIAHSATRSAADPAVVCVDPDRLDEVWPHAGPVIGRAFDRIDGDDSLDDLLNDLHLRRALLWIAWDGTEIVAAAATKLLKVARGTVCAIVACGGHDMSPGRWRAAIALIEGYARAEGCCVIRFEGRRGWKMMFPDYREVWIALEKRLAR